MFKIAFEQKINTNTNDSQKTWEPLSWQNFEKLQQPDYSDQAEYENVCQTLKNQSPIVELNEVLELKENLIKCQNNEMFFLQAGDCAERFVDAKKTIITQKANLIYQMASKMRSSLNKDILTIGRIAGQYAKPRTETLEMRDNMSLPVYRGDMINGYNFTAQARQADPKRLLRSYENAKKTYLCLKDNAKKRTHQPIFISHEGLHLGYESSLTYAIPVGSQLTSNRKFWNGGAHLLWLGERTRKLESAHVEYLRGIVNPLAIKISVKANPEEVIEIVKRLNPEEEPGKIVLITRLGYKNVSDFLPGFVEKIKSAQIPVTWCVDPMHGNTLKTKQGIKTRVFAQIYSEILSTLRVHKQIGTHLGGLHLETSYLEVTECINNDDEQVDPDAQLERMYTSYCDPRLNKSQSMKILEIFENEV